MANGILFVVLEVIIMAMAFIVMSSGTWPVSKNDIRAPDYPLKFGTAWPHST